MLSMPKFKYPAHVFRNTHQEPQDLPETCGTTCLDGNNNDDREAVCVLATSVDWESWLQSSAQSLAPALASCKAWSEFPNLSEPPFPHP